MSLRRITGFLAPFLLLAGSAGAAAPDSVSGTVFLDGNGNGARDGGEKGLAGVAVTDGTDFVRTGEDGTYTIAIGDDPMIPYRPARVVSVSWPTGHWPSGRWWRRLSEVQAGDRVDFGLRAQEQTLPFVVFQASDDHGQGGAYEMLGQKVTRYLGGNVAFGVMTGDLGYAKEDNAATMFVNVAANAKKFPWPMFFTAGNHDFVGKEGEWDKQHDLYGHGGFTKSLGPVRWSFTYAGVHAVGLDWATTRDGKYAEGVPPIAARWLEKDLSLQEPGTRTLLFVHFPGGCDAFRLTVGKHKVAHILAGHTHSYGRYSVEGVLATTPFNVRGNGVGLLGIVGRDDISVVYWCLGCKPKNRHDRTRCAFGVMDRAILAPYAGRRAGHAGLRGKTVAGSFAVEGTDAFPAVDVAFQLQRGTAKSAGLQLGKEKPIRVVWDGDTVNVAGTPIPFRGAGKVLYARLVLHKNRLIFTANSVLFLDKPFAFKGPLPVSLVAEGGEAVFGKVDVWGLRAE